MQLQSTLTCPNCAHQATEAMPTDACQYSRLQELRGAPKAEAWRSLPCHHVRA
jgi:hypothetical protein